VWRRLLLGVLALVMVGCHPVPVGAQSNPVPSHPVVFASIAGNQDKAVFNLPRSFPTDLGDWDKYPRELYPLSADVALVRFFGAKQDYGLVVKFNYTPVMADDVLLGALQSNPDGSNLKCYLFRGGKPIQTDEDTFNTEIMGLLNSETL